MGLLNRGFFVVILLFLIPFRLFGVEDFERLCIEEVKKEKINRELVIEYCAKAGDEAVKLKGFNDASLYYLLAGDFDKNINEIQFKIDNNFLVTVGHSYLLKKDFKKAERLYKKFLRYSKIPWADEKIENEFKVLLKFYPKQKNSIKNGIKIWNRLYEPLKSVNYFYEIYKEKKREEKYKEAIDYLIKIIELQKKFQDNDNLGIADTFEYIGTMYYLMGNRQKALEYLKKSLTIKEKILGKESFKTTKMYTTIGLLYQDMDKYKKSLYYLTKTLLLYKKFLGKEHIGTAKIYLYLGLVYREMSNYKKALIYLNSSLAIKQKLFGEKHILIAELYNHIGLVYQEESEYEKALVFLNKSLIINEKVLGKLNRVTSTNYNNIGTLYLEINKYKESLDFLKKSLVINETLFGKDNIEIAVDYNHIGILYQKMNNYKKALEYLKKSLVINKIKLGEEHHTTAISYQNIGLLYYDMDKDKKALKSCRKSLIINEKVFGINHTITSKSYECMGSIYANLHNYDKALMYLYKSLSINEKYLGKEHILVAKNYANIAGIHFRLGSYKEALKYYKKSLIITEKKLDVNNPAIAEEYSNLSVIYFSIKEYQKSYSYAINSFKIFKKNRDKSLSILTEQEKENYLHPSANIMNFLLLVSSQYLIELEKNKKSEISKIKKDIFQNWFNHKGTIFQYKNILSMIERNPIIDEQTKSLIKNLKKITIKLANLDENNQNYQKNKLKIEEQLSNIEVNLSNQNQKFREHLKLDKLDYINISQQLKLNQLYIDFAKTDKNYYIFTLNKNNEINFIQINEEDTKNLDENIKKLESNNKNIAQVIADKIVNLKQENLKQESQVILSKLYTTLMSKYLVKELKDKDSLIISPDGLLNALPFEALYHNGRYLIQDYQISYISSGREFVRQTKREKAETKYEMICFGDPDFNTTLPIGDIRKLEKQNKKKKLDTWEQYTEFSPIGDAEVKMIRELYKNNTLVYEGKRATVKNLMSVESPKILHLSTHGKFLNNPNILNSMLRGGLAFSGANKNLDGIVTALELSALDLKNTDLVVLSACESGVGKVQNAEGVVGLPKAFLQAGARNVVMSLWSVSNLETTKLMRYFYENINKGQNYVTALRNAKIEMIKMHPYYWSAFIIHGIQN